MIPDVGAIVKGTDIGKGKSTGRWAWVRCPGCKAERWVHWKTYGSNTARLCEPCRLKNGAKWKITPRGEGQYDNRT